MQTRKVVLGIGNLLFGDEGFGIHVLQHLQVSLGEQARVEWVDGGVLGLNLLPLVETSSHLLVLDAIEADQPPGTLIEIPQDLVSYYSYMKL